MELQQEGLKSGALPTTTLRNLSSSSSAFMSASQSPFFSPRSPTHGSDLLHSNKPDNSIAGPLNADIIRSKFAIQESCSSGIRYGKAADSRVANASPFFSLRLPTSQGPEILYPDKASNSNACSLNADILRSKISVHENFSCGIKYDEGAASHVENAPPSNFEDYRQSPSTEPSDDSSSDHNQTTSSTYLEYRVKQKCVKRHGKFSCSRSSSLLSSNNKQRSTDVYLGFHGRRSSLRRFANWFRAELEIQGISCFAADRAQCKNSRSHTMVERAMNAAKFGVVILTKKSFSNSYSIEELRNFLGRKNLMPVFFDLGANDCLARDIVERRGDIWEKHGGELWMLYGGVEKEWKDAIDGLARVDNIKMEAHEGNWRDCILRSVVLLATWLGRRSVVEKVNRWKEKIEKEEFPFPRNDNFIGRKKELSELELILFGDISGDGQKEYFELKTRRRRQNLIFCRTENSRTDESTKNKKSDSSNKSKEPIVWKESEREIEMRKMESSTRKLFRSLRTKSRGKHGKRLSVKILYGKGIACVSGDPGIGKTELLLEYAYRFCQRYKMVLWIGGESRYIRQNYLNLRSFLEVDVGIENHCLEKGKPKCFEEQEEEAIARVRKELMRDIPYLIIIDNLEKDKDWWDHRNILELLPLFGRETHIIVSTHLPRVMSLEPMKLTYLSGVEAMSLMKGACRDYPVIEVDALRVIEERLGRLTLGLAIVGSILSELPISPSRLLDTVNRMPKRDLALNDQDEFTLKKHTFFMQLLDVCFSIFDHADGPQSLATLMAQASGWFSPATIPLPLLALAARNVPQKHQGSRIWKRCMASLSCSFAKSNIRRSEVEASSMLVRFGIAKVSTRPQCIHFHDIIKLYAQKRGGTRAARAVVQAISLRGSISQHPEHLWAACFLLFGFGTDPVTVELDPSELMVLVKRVVLPLAVHTFITFSRCSAALELLRLCTDVLEASAETVISRNEKWFDNSFCCMRHVHYSLGVQSTYLWQELALLRATVLETRAKLLLRGGQYDMGESLIRKAIFIRTSICGEHHPDTVSARETHSKLTRLLTNVHVN